MAKETKSGILKRDELLWDVAMRGIGIQLPDEYVLRFVRLLDKVKQLGLGQVSLSDFADIENEARQEMMNRTTEGDKA